MLLRQKDEDIRHALADARAAFEKEHGRKQEELDVLTDMYENGEESIQHLTQQLAEWQHMQKVCLLNLYLPYSPPCMSEVFRNELDAKFQQHTAFRKEQESWRMLRKVCSKLCWKLVVFTILLLRSLIWKCWCCENKWRHCTHRQPHSTIEAPLDHIMM